MGCRVPRFAAHYVASSRGEKREGKGKKKKLLAHGLLTSDTLTTPRPAGLESANQQALSKLGQLLLIPCSRPWGGTLAGSCVCKVQVHAWINR